MQGPGLIGPEGLAPVEATIGNLSGDQFWSVFIKYPSFLFLSSSNLTLYILSTLMVVVGLILCFGFCNIILIVILWLVQLSLVNGGGLFYSYGWETMMLEMTWLSIFFLHPWKWSLKSGVGRVPHSWAFAPLIWMAFRLMLGAGLIKIRGDSCWLDLTCMDVHYQTQPNPHFLSWYYHFLPEWFHRIEVVLTHFYELLLPFCLLLGRKLRQISALLLTFFQLTLISTGNLAYLNWQTIVLLLVCFDDQFYMSLFRLWNWSWLDQLIPIKPSKRTHYLVWAGVFLIAVLSYPSVKNMISTKQRMNQSYDGLHLINSYGLFGSITKRRYEIVISGTKDSQVTENSLWQEYEFLCKPGLVDRRPCWITPYHLRLDWQMWFSAMRPNLSERWLQNLAIKMLYNDPVVDQLLAYNPFAGGSPPNYVKMDLYLYEFSDDGENWWKRSKVKTYMAPIHLKPQ